MQLGQNVLKYDGAKLPNGVTINGRFFYDEGKEEKNKLEEDLDNFRFGDPINAFFVG
jgi:hypothetical protein